ncbi:hypothetical protein [Nonomuraea sp. NEAU-A123]|uniref:hypothetical protein n=1 Tax=Nonomuraea sp. NEAU-A123 TaxID=2839649 RepID=UPI001BE4B32B|nr:hypothetical protein [Nonomuraea sp. NEAU-A123]MBT2226270.1 hypothetical protein [Nonomuraea sp. NEAU-A123]
MAISARRRRNGIYTVQHTTTAPGSKETRSLTAAVQVLTGRRITRTAAATTSVQAGWQVEAWEMYDQVGEMRFAVNLVANAISRCRLVAGRMTPGIDDPEPIDDGVPADLVADFAGGRGGQGAFLTRAVQHLTVPGDSYFVGRRLEADEIDPGGPAEEWRPYSTEETTHGPNGWQVNPGDGAIDLGADDMIFRCWLPSPRRWTQAESSVGSALPVLREVHGLTQRIMAEIDSRLAGNGLLVLPQEFEMLRGQGAQTEAGAEASFVETLLDYMITPIKDRGTASAVVPLIVTAPGDYIAQAQHIKFFNELDGRSHEIREGAITRLARSMDMPPEVMLGLSDSNHWSAWAIDRDVIQLHLAPLLGVICWALTIGWYRPALAAASVPNADQLVVWYDTSTLEIPPDRSEAAKDLYDRYAIGPVTLRRETGFQESDAPTSAELKEMILLKLVDRISDPRALLEALGVSVADVPELAPPAAPTPAIGTGDDQGDEGPPDNAPDSVQASGTLTPVELAYVAELAVQRALELAGKRLLTRHYRATRPDLNHTPATTLHVHIPAAEHELDRLLAGAWDPVLAVVPNARALVDRLDEYVRDLLRTSTAHEAQYLARLLSTGE